MPSFCRHGRLEANCPICSKRGAAPGTPAGPRPAGRRPASAPRPASTARRRGGGDLKVRRLARAADDGYEHELVLGLRASADAAALADEIAFSVARLDELAADPPGLYAEVAGADDREEALWLAFLIADLSPLEAEDPWSGIAAARVPWSTGEVPAVADAPRGPRGSSDPRAPGAYRAWAARAGSQSTALEGDPLWAPERRFDRGFERLALPGFGRAQRYELLTVLRHLGVLDVRPTSLQLLSEQTDPTVVAAKRAFGIGIGMELRQRVTRLASELDVPIEALDLALVNWNRPPGQPRITAGSRRSEGDPERRTLLRDALGVGAPEDAPAA